MSIDCNKTELGLNPINELKDYTFTIPFMQRGYKWRSDNVIILLNDLKEFMEQDTQKVYCLQPLAVVEIEKNKNYELIDGQQRMTTLFLIYKYVTGGKAWFNFEYEKDSKREKGKDVARFEFLKNTDGTIDNSNIDYFYISNAYNAIKNWFNNDDDLKSNFKNLLEETNVENKSVQIIWYEVPKETAAETFRNINSGKIQLTNSDLIKALLLNRSILDKNPADKDVNLQKQSQIAAQFELVQQQMEEDRFWFMFNKKDVEIQKGQTRMDFLFNLVCNVNEESYATEPRTSFFDFAKLQTFENLLERWKKVRNQFQILKDLYDNPYTFHYIGYLIYSGKTITSILKLIEKKSKEDQITELRKSIKLKGSINDYNYEMKKSELRNLFVLHNIETLLKKYEELHLNKNLKFAYEQFPFELLYSQEWNIEHIDSRTPNDYKSEVDRKDFVEAFEADYVETNRITAEQKKDFYEKWMNEIYFQNTDAFKEFKKWCDEVTKGKEEQIEDENILGNLVLLDAHTNKSFHNSLFPKKRRIVIMASGLKNETDTEENVESVFVPICTRQIYTKMYNKDSSVVVGTWTKTDAEAYVQDIKEKLKKYFIVKDE